MKNRFGNRQTLNLQVPPSGAGGNVNPLQPNGEIRAESGAAAAALRVVQDLGNNFQPSRSLMELGLFKESMQGLGILK
jgi:hypothetical protein